MILMKKIARRSNPTFAVLLTLLATLVTGASQDSPRSGIYAIQSGTYRVVGGLFGTYALSLPAPSQRFYRIVALP
jgi:hypothetical protein